MLLQTYLSWSWHISLWYLVLEFHINEMTDILMYLDVSIFEKYFSMNLNFIIPNPKQLVGCFVSSC